MKLHRKLLSKFAIDYAITFTAGVIVGWLVKPKKEIEALWEALETEMQYADIINKKVASLTDIESEQNITYISPDVEILGSWDRVLTNDEIKQVRSAGVDGIRASFEDTQEIKIDKSFKS